MNLDELKKILTNRETYRGLSPAEAKLRLDEYGPNARPHTQPKHWGLRLWGIISEPMMLLLFATAVVYFFVGSPLETAILGLSLLPIVGMEFVQSKKTDAAIAALDTLLVEKCQVFRDGELHRLDSSLIVPGDLVYITAGDKIPADGYLLTSPGALVDEAILTGESVPVIKHVAPPHIDNCAAEHFLSQGTLLVQGEGYLVVSATGKETEYGKLGSLLEKIAPTDTPLQKKINRLVKTLAVAAITIAIAMGIFLSWSKGIVTGLVGALTIAIAIIPEEFPIVFSVFLIMGVWRMSKRQALVREMAMIETLGSATVICTDKTGTLTEGSMALNKVWCNGDLSEVSTISSTAPFKTLIEDSLLALEQVAVDPIEIEIQRSAKELGITVSQFHAARRLVKDSSFNSQTKTVTHMWQEGNELYQYIAGAPEAVLDICTLTPPERAKLDGVCLALAEDGYRMIGVAKRPCQDPSYFASSGFTLSGLLFMSDPPRAGVREAIKLCQDAGIQVLMITGDNPVTAQSIADAIGLRHSAPPVLGSELENKTSAELGQLVKRHTIYARVRPEQKYALVEALQQSGEIVAMTGDGVNDAPALKKADIGIAMGKKGTEVARAASGIVLLDDNFTTIVTAVHEGRRIYDNLRQAFVFLFSFHIPIIGLSFLPIFFGGELFFLPIHIIFLEFFGDPASVIGFERDAARTGLMNEPPRRSTESLINPRLWGRVLVQGLAITAVSFGVYYVLGIAGSNTGLGRTAAFLALVVTQAVLIMGTREWRQVKNNTVLLLITAGTLIVLHLILFVAPLQAVFHFITLPAQVYTITVAISVASMLLISWLVKPRRSPAPFAG